jgi:glutaredoxin/glutathione-dependent peroxiredoxin
MISVGDRLPEGTFRIKNDEGTAVQISAADLFGGQTVVLVGVPGAFTSTCHNAHIPQFVANAGAFKNRGIDRIIVMATNDHHVMRAWGEALGDAGTIDFVADGNGDYTRALGLEVDLSASGLGRRCKRFSALVRNAVVETLNFEPEGGKGISTTGAATMLEALA